MRSEAKRSRHAPQAKPAVVGRCVSEASTPLFSWTSWCRVSCFPSPYFTLPLAAHPAAPAGAKGKAPALNGIEGVVLDGPADAAFPTLKPQRAPVIAPLREAGESGGKVPYLDGVPAPPVRDAERASSEEQQPPRGMIRERTYPAPPVTATARDADSNDGTRAPNDNGEFRVKARGRLHASPCACRARGCFELPVGKRDKWSAPPHNPCRSARRSLWTGRRRSGNRCDDGAVPAGAHPQERGCWVPSCAKEGM